MRVAYGVTSSSGRGSPSGPSTIALRCRDLGFDVVYTQTNLVSLTPGLMGILPLAWFTLAAQRAVVGETQGRLRIAR